MSEALRSRTDIGQAVGILIERHQIDADRAFAQLVHLSSTTNTKLRQIADNIVAELPVHERDSG